MRHDCNISRRHNINMETTHIQMNANYINVLCNRLNASGQIGVSPPQAPRHTALPWIGARDTSKKLLRWKSKSKIQPIQAFLRVILQATEQMAASGRIWVLDATARDFWSMNPRVMTTHNGWFSPNSKFRHLVFFWRISASVGWLSLLVSLLLTFRFMIAPDFIA